MQRCGGAGAARRRGARFVLLLPAAGGRLKKGPARKNNLAYGCMFCSRAQPDRLGRASVVVEEDEKRLGCCREFGSVVRSKPASHTAAKPDKRPQTSRAPPAGVCEGQYRRSITKPRVSKVVRMSDVVASLAEGLLRDLAQTVRAIDSS